MGLANNSNGLAVRLAARRAHFADEVNEVFAVWSCHRGLTDRAETVGCRSADLIVAIV
jgi:hypothetical protein